MNQPSSKRKIVHSTNAIRSGQRGLRETVRGSLLIATAVLCFSLSAKPAYSQQMRSDSIEASLAGHGEMLFTQEWSTGARDGLGGDGLGPLFNEKSCVACHFQGGTGGGGPLRNNVEVLSAKSTKGDTRPTRAYNAQLAKVHPAFFSDGNVKQAFVFHRFSTSGQYEDERIRFLGIPTLDRDRNNVARYRAMTYEPVHRVQSSSAVQVFSSERNSTSLFGVGVIDSIPDAEIQRVANLQPTAFPGVSGRTVPRAEGLAKFGWRLRSVSLSEFVNLACATEMGLTTPSFAQAKDPTHNGGYKATPDMTAEEVDALTTFCASLPAPRPRVPADPELRAAANQGKRHFTKLGCVACHLETLGPAEDIYSDLLLHDMGESLADPAAAPENTLDVVKTYSFPGNLAGQVESVAAITTVQIVPRVISSQSGNRGLPQQGIPLSPPGPALSDYYSPPLLANDGTRAQVPDSSTGRAYTTYRDKIYLDPPSTAECEYRTPPLWGMRDSAPYMHDGRAQTPVEAIAYHGGEGESSRDAFFELSPSEQSDLLAFLDTLRVE